MLVDITVDHDKVRLAGVDVAKPQSISATDWLRLWDAMSDINEHVDTIDRLRDELQNARDENDALRDERDSLRDEVTRLESALMEARDANG